LRVRSDRKQGGRYLRLFSSFGRHPGVSANDSHKPTFRYGIVEKQLASVGVPPCEDGSRRSSASISRDLTTGNLPNQACELPMDAFVRRIAFSLWEMFLDIAVVSDSGLSRPSPGEEDDVYGQQIVNESKEHVIVPRAPLGHDLNHCTKDAPEDIQPAAY